MADAFVEGRQGEENVEATVEEELQAAADENATEATSIEEIVDVVEGNNETAE